MKDANLRMALRRLAALQASLDGTERFRLATQIGLIAEDLLKGAAPSKRAELCRLYSEAADADKRAEARAELIDMKTETENR